MKKRNIATITLFAAVALASLLVLGGMAVAQSTQVQGIIDGRRGATMTVKTQIGRAHV